jgi:hypothetical protein
VKPSEGDGEPSVIELLMGRGKAVDADAEEDR